MTQDGTRARFICLRTELAVAIRTGRLAFILRHVATGQGKGTSGGERDTTNNRMELLAVFADWRPSNAVPGRVVHGQRLCR